MGRERIKGSFVLNSAEETLLFGARFASFLQPGDTLALIGDLGSGKTTFMKGLLKGLRVEDTAQSPTFTLLQSYAGPFPIHHFDLYRIKNEREFLSLGFDEFLSGSGVTAIEWAERIESILPENSLTLKFTYGPSGGRTVVVT
jgi:tRNA threonylcarbamoyladenosine biosynthesis protein TsaE